MGKIKKFVPDSVTGFAHTLEKFLQWKMKFIFDMGTHLTEREICKPLIRDHIIHLHRSIPV